MRNIIIDFAMVAISSALVFYLALQSIPGTRYAGAGFSDVSHGLVASWILLVIFAFGTCRLVFHLRRR